MVHFRVAPQRMGTILGLVILSLLLVHPAMAAGFKIEPGVQLFYPVRSEVYDGAYGLVSPILQQRLTLNNEWAIQLREYLLFVSGSVTGGRRYTIRQAYSRQIVPISLSLIYTFPWSTKVYVGGGGGIYLTRTRLEEQQDSALQVWSNRQRVLGSHLLVGLMPLKHEAWLAIEASAEWFWLDAVRAGYGDGGAGGGIRLGVTVRFG